MITESFMRGMHPVWRPVIRQYAERVEQLWLDGKLQRRWVPLRGTLSSRELFQLKKLHHSVPHELCPYGEPEQDYEYPEASAHMQQFGLACDFARTNAEGKPVMGGSIDDHEALLRATAGLPIRRPTPHTDGSFHVEDILMASVNWGNDDLDEDSPTAREKWWQMPTFDQLLAGRMWEYPTTYQPPKDGWFAENLKEMVEREAVRP